jgi:hypothetical protein
VVTAVLAQLLIYAVILAPTVWYVRRSQKRNDQKWRDHYAEQRRLDREVP